MAQYLAPVPRSTPSCEASDLLRVPLLRRQLTVRPLSNSAKIDKIRNKELCKEYG